MTLLRNQVDIRRMDANFSLLARYTKRTSHIWLKQDKYLDLLRRLGAFSPSAGTEMGLGRAVRKAFNET